MKLIIDDFDSKGTETSSTDQSDDLLSLMDAL